MFHDLFGVAARHPPHDTVGRVYSVIDPVEFQESFAHWMRGIQDAARGEVVSIDGKAPRRSHDRGAGQAPIHEG